MSHNKFIITVAALSLFIFVRATIAATGYESKVSLTIKPSASTDGELCVNFENISPSKTVDRIVTTAFTCQLSDSTVEVDFSSNNYIFGWSGENIDGSNSYDKNALIIGTILPQNSSNASLCMRLPSLLKKQCLLSDELCLFIEPQSRKMQKFFTSKDSYFVFHPLTRVQINLFDKWTAIDKQALTQMGTHSFEWDANNPEKENKIFLSFKTTAFTDNLLLIASSFLIALFLGIALSRKIYQLSSNRWFIRLSYVLIFTGLGVSLVCYFIGCFEIFISYSTTLAMFGFLIGFFLGPKIPHNVAQITEELR